MNCKAEKKSIVTMMTPLQKVMTHTHPKLNKRAIQSVSLVLLHGMGSRVGRVTWVLF